MDSSGYMVERATPKAGTLARTKADAGGDAGTLDDAAFRVFYQQHARAVWSYLYRVMGNASQADDLMQEAFCRFLTAPVADLDESQQRGYVFRIAGNLAIDQWRRGKAERAFREGAQAEAEAAGGGRSSSSGGPNGSRGGSGMHGVQEPGAPGAQPTARDMDVSRTFKELKPRERALLWLAYVEESGHDDIAASLGLAPKSVRVLLFRARRKLASLLRQRGIGSAGAEGRREI